ncbi:MAG: hypothetical protein LBT01_00070 [Spirochaetaceae bacterium]|jgi:hypothetical protein|nr:hypothetical protein [Spirochaetaceae bacterium]
MMGISKKLFFVVCFLCSASFFQIYAANISFMVIETGGAALAAKGMAELWEDGIMDVFFDAGHIISNARTKKIPAQPTKEEFPEEALRDFQDADEGSSEYFIIAFLNYGDTITTEATAPESVNLRLYKVAPYKFLMEKTANGKYNPSEDALTDVKKLAKAIIPYIGRKM